MNIPVIIVVFNRPEYTQVCLDALYKVDHGCIIRPIIVDNGSRNRTMTMLQEWVDRWQETPECHGFVSRPTILRMDKNRGFAAGLNLGIAEARKSDPPFFIVLHNDTVVFPGWAGEMFACMSEADEEVAVIVPRTNYANEHSMCIKEVRERFEKIKPDNKMRILPEEIVDLVERTYPEGVRAFLEEVRKEPLRTSYSPEVACFCMMVRTRVFEENPGFDEDFFPRGYEDKFWFITLERSGFVTQIANHAFVHHFCNITSDGAGFSMPREMAILKQKFEEKVLELNRRGAVKQIQGEVT